MGYFITEDFQTLHEWQLPGIGYDAFTLGVTDWPDLMSADGKAQSLRLMFHDKPLGAETYFRKKYATPVQFVQTDYYGKKILFPELILTLMIQANGAKFRIPPVNPDEIYLSMSLWFDQVKMREWYVPFPSSGINTNYVGQCFDLKPLIDAGHTQYDEVRFHIIQNPYPIRVYFGDLYLAQDEVEHNLAVSIQNSLHLKLRTRLTTLADPVSSGDGVAILTSGVDIYENTVIAIGDPDGVYELHAISSAPYEDEDTGAVRVTFTGEFDTSNLIMDWPAGTDVWFVVPSTMGDLSDSESSYPTFHITWDAPRPVPDWTPDFGRQLDSYVRDPVNGDSVAVRLSSDTVRIPVKVHVFSPTIEIAADMWRFLRYKFDEQSFIYVAGSPVEYDVNEMSNMNPEADILEEMPHYVLEIDCYPTENVHGFREYRSFPALKVLTRIESVVNE